MRFFSRQGGNASTNDRDIVVIGKDGCVETTDLSSGLAGLRQQRALRRRRRIVTSMASLFCATLGLMAIAHAISVRTNISPRMDLATALFIMSNFFFGAIPSNLFAQELRTDRWTFFKLSLLSWGVYLAAGRLAFYLLVPLEEKPLTLGVMFCGISVAAQLFAYLLRGCRW